MRGLKEEDGLMVLSEETRDGGIHDEREVNAGDGSASRERISREEVSESKSKKEKTANLSNAEIGGSHRTASTYLD